MTEAVKLTVSLRFLRTLIGRSISPVSEAPRFHGTFPKNAMVDYDAIDYHINLM